MGRSRTWVKSLGHVFSWRTEPEKDAQVQYARLCVLFDDLMREHEGVFARAGTEVETSHEARAREFYFMRRALATLQEIASAITLLDRNAAFKRSKRAWQPSERQTWDLASTFFMANHELLKEWRNDMGGHFQTKAARHAVEHFNDDTVGALELYESPRDHRKHSVRMKFTFDIIAGGMARRLTDGQSLIVFMESNFDILGEAFGHAAQSIHALVHEEILPRFR